MTSKLDHALLDSFDNYADIKNIEKIKSILNALIHTKSKGFRGVVLTAIVGKHLDKSFDPLKNFYGCNPRSIFEKGIYYALQNRIPCGKSDPLNVAKNINVLDREWARGKRPQTSAIAVVEFLEILENESNRVKREKLIGLFFLSLIDYVRDIQSLQIDIPSQKNLDILSIGNVLYSFVVSYPESGTTPQYIVYLLMKALYENSKVVVEGGEDSVFGTNTTSKKLADIWLSINNKPFNLFEITVKIIDFKRLDDCLENLNELKGNNLPLTFIACESNYKDLSVQNGSLEYKGRVFNFLKIDSFIFTICTLLSTIEIANLFISITKHINDINRPIHVRKGWKRILESSELK